MEVAGPIRGFGSFSAGFVLGFIRPTSYAAAFASILLIAVLRFIGAYAWYVYFSHGYVSYRDKTNNNYVRCVRAGPRLQYLMISGVLYGSR